MAALVEVQGEASSGVIVREPAGTKRARLAGMVYEPTVRTFLLASAAIVVSGCGTSTPSRGGANDAPDVQFTVDLWPGEGIPVIESRRDIQHLRETPDLGAPVSDTLKLPVGRRVAFDSTRFQTVEAGVIRVVGAIRVTGRELGSIDHLTQDAYYRQALPNVDIPVADSGTIEYLQDRAEGTCFVRIARRVVDANPCPALDTGRARIERHPITRWWIGIRGRGGAFGWLLVSDSTAQAVRREFQLSPRGARRR